MPQSSASVRNELNEINRSAVKGWVRRVKVIVPWNEGLHLRHAALLVRTARKFQARISFACAGRIADAQSILSVIALAATMGSALDIEASGEDEQDASQAIEQVFVAPDRAGR